jgi:hypothetical protein
MHQLLFVLFLFKIKFKKKKKRKEKKEPCDDIGDEDKDDSEIEEDLLC